MDPLYSAMATAEGGRNGRVSTSDGSVDVQLTMPKGLGGPETPGTTNPEQLFASGYAACFHGALLAMARNEKVDVSGSSVTAVVGIGKTDDGGLGLAVELEVNVPGVDQETAQRLAEKAHGFCPYSKATRGNIDVALDVTTLAG
ncbi:MAG: organic hydroperoxide resistance protein [Actinobacteria bacterium]|nr:organic hydroperoxide resistance protein [Actinomycetota bacterium]